MIIVIERRQMEYYKSYNYQALICINYYIYNLEVL